MRSTIPVFNDPAQRILSGALHYFRVVPEYWEDRLRKLRYMGLNTVETYVPWNLHEPRPGDFVFDGRLDLERFLGLAAELGLLAIIRPGPYICSEWDFGGFPAWLLAEHDLRLRCADAKFLAAVDRFYDQLIPRLARRQHPARGPLIAAQVENEYGSYGSDREYLRYLADGLRRRGITVPLFTSDGPGDAMLTGGTLPDIRKTVNFGHDAAGAFAKLQQHQPHEPKMCAEFWVHDAGGFLHWGEHRRPRDPREVATILDDILSAGASANLYMFHGGTNFGFMNGANYEGGYKSTINSYDMDAPLDEAGDPTPKYWALRDVIGKYAPLPHGEPQPLSQPKISYGEVTLDESVCLFDALGSLGEPLTRITPEPMERLGQDYGFILYRTRVMGPREPQPLVLQEVHDRALIFMDGQNKGVIERSGPQDQVILEFGAGIHDLDVLVENMGRINYGPYLHDHKGITEGVRLGNQFLYHWQIYCLPLTNLSALSFRHGLPNHWPAFYRGHFSVNTVADTFLALPGWTKGVCFLNGFNLSRYWCIGPQRTYYVPAPLFRKGVNELIVFELHTTLRPVAEFRDHHEWQ